VYRRFGKRLLDLLVVSFALWVCCPILALVALLIRLVFRQRRSGLHGEPFTLFKFRTMTGQRDASGNLLPDAERLTTLGHFLRSTSADELPELFNILRGDMSLVGPRPLYAHYLERYDERQRRRLEARPGITGWAVIQGRNLLTWEKKFAYDVWYVDNCSLQLDLRIIFRTIEKTIRREGISQPGQATAEEFKGSAGA
jgi:sugar transferase EpsL